MPRPPEICVAVLAAGQSRRFGKADKLAQPMHGKRLGLHICDTLLPLHYAQYAVITSTQDHPCAAGWHARGFETIVNTQAEQGLGTSVALAATFAQRKMADALLICLADMPFIPAAHLEQLVSAYTQAHDHTVIASGNGDIASPPAIFGKQNFPALKSLSGAAGARGLLATADTVPAPSECLMDIDTRAQLTRANAHSRQLAQGRSPGL